jgi:hypothetical protein
MLRLNNQTFYLYFLILTQILISCKKEIVSSPEIITLAASGISETSARVGGNVINERGADVTDRGICYSKTSNPTVADQKIQSGAGNGSFLVDITGLSPGTQYYAKAYAVNSAGIGYGNEVVFITAYAKPTVSTSDVTDLSETSAKSGGAVSSDGGSPVTERGICFSINSSPTLTDAKVVSGAGQGDFISQMMNLIPNTKYYVRAYATNQAGTSFGEVKTFKTLSNSLNNGLIAYYKFTGNLIDSSGFNRSTMILNGDIAFTNDRNGKINSAALFRPGIIMHVREIPNLNLSNVSISFWRRYPNSNSVVPHRIFSLIEKFNIDVASSNTLGRDTLQVTYETSGSFSRIHSYINNFGTNWNHMVIKFWYVQNQYFMEIYQNGVFVRNLALPKTIFDYDLGIISFSSGTFGYNIEIDEYRIYNRSLEPEEIVKLSKE